MSQLPPTYDPATNEYAVSWLRRNPVILLVLSLLLPALGAAVTAWAQGETLVAILISAVVVLLGTLGPIVYRAVTPLNSPRGEDGVPLAPMIDPAQQLPGGVTPEQRSEASGFSSSTVPPPPHA